MIKNNGKRENWERIAGEPINMDHVRKLERATVNGRHAIVVTWSNGDQETFPCISEYDIDKILEMKEKRNNA